MPSGAPPCLRAGDDRSSPRGWPGPWPALGRPAWPSPGGRCRARRPEPPSRRGRARSLRGRTGCPARARSERTGLAPAPGRFREGFRGVTRQSPARGGRDGSADRRFCRPIRADTPRSEEHTSELQSHHDLVCRLLLEKKKKTKKQHKLQKKKKKTRKKT